MCLTCLKTSYTDAHFTLCSSYCRLKAPTTGRCAQSNPKVTQKGPHVPRVRWCHQAETKGGVRQVAASEVSVYTTGANGGREKVKEDKNRMARGGRSQQAPPKIIYTCEKSKSYEEKSWWIAQKNVSMSLTSLKCNLGLECNTLVVLKIKQTNKQKNTKTLLKLPKY